MATVPTKPEDMSGFTGRVITLVVFVVPTILTALVGLIFGNGYTASGFAILWLAVITAASLKFQRKRTFSVVERFGYFWDVKFAGVRLVIPFIDTPVDDDDFLQKQVQLFLAEDGKTSIEIDFIGASAPIDAAAWYQIANPVDVDQGNWPAVREQILKYVYRVRSEERANRVAEIFQGVFRPLLEKVELKKAQKKMLDIARDATTAAGPALAEIGVYPFPEKGIIVRDIALPQEVIELRQRELRGQVDAIEAINRARAYSEPIINMRKQLVAGNITLTDQELTELYLKQKGLETVKGAPMTFVSPDLGAVLKTLMGNLTTKQ